VRMDTLVYLETVHDYLQGGKVVSKSPSACEEPPLQNAGIAPPQREDDAERAAKARADADRVHAELRA